MGRALATLIALVLLQGCAYYNTFYHAKKSYARARKLEETSKTDRLSPEAIKLYDKAIEKAAKVIVEHGGGWRAGVDEALLLMGACYYGKHEYEMAIGRFNELLINYPESSKVPEALFYTGLCYHGLRNFAAATQVFEGLLREHPDFPRRDEIHFITAGGLKSAGEEEGALRQYARLAAEFRQSRYREKALAEIGAIHFEDGRYDSSLAAYEDLALTTRDDQAYVDAQLNAGACLVRLGRHAEALSIYERILPDDAERNELTPRIWIAMADAENRSGDHARAIEHLQLVADNFESRVEGTEALFQIGYTNEVYVHDYEAARKAYESASASRTRSVFKDQADRRLENLRTLLKLQADTADSAAVDSIAIGRDDRAQAALRVAEFSLFDGDDPRGALARYTEIPHDFPGTTMALRALYAQGWMLTTWPELDTLNAAQGILLELAAQHPETPQAEGALAILTERGTADSVLAPVRAVVRAARRTLAIRDSIATADSLAAARAVQDSLALIRAAQQAAEEAKEKLPSEEGLPGEAKLPIGEERVKARVRAEPVSQRPAEIAAEPDTEAVSKKLGEASEAGDALPDTLELERAAGDSLPLQPSPLGAPMRENAPSDSLPPPKEEMQK
jgi:tetratricopeptide (TPR) repeat protein